MKTLYESILDDEDVLINNVDKIANWHETVIEYVKNGKYEACAKWLNDNIKLFKNGQFVGNDIYEYLVYKKDEYDPCFLIFIDYRAYSKSFTICFAECDDMVEKYGLTKYLKESGISLKEYNKFKNNIIKNFKVNKHPSIKGQYERKIN